MLLKTAIKIDHEFSESGVPQIFYESTLEFRKIDAGIVKVLSVTLILTELFQHNLINVSYLTAC